MRYPTPKGHISYNPDKDVRKIMDNASIAEHIYCISMQLEDEVIRLDLEPYDKFPDKYASERAYDELKSAASVVSALCSALDRSFRQFNDNRYQVYETVMDEIAPEDEAGNRIDYSI